LAACGAPPAKGVRVLTYASPYSPGHPFSRADQTWMKFVEARSGGRIKIKAYWSGALLSSDQTLEEIRHGVADIGLITPIYARGGAHLVRTQAGFYGGVKTIQDQIAVYKCLQREFPEIDREMAGIHVLAVQGGNFPGVVTRNRPVANLADFKGLRLRVPTELTGVLRRLGADPVDMPMGEVYSAMAKGVVDGVVAPTDTLKSLHFGEIAHFYATLHVSRGAYPARAMSEKTWKSLPPDLQAVLTEGQPVWEKAMASELIKAAKSGEEYGRQAAIKFTPFDPAGQAQFDAIYNESALAEARKLKSVGLDGEPVFRRTQALIAAGATCDGAPG
jgi:TRAP-type C4-dicarboxylate transport system substrate-binding protein